MKFLFLGYFFILPFYFQAQERGEKSFKEVDQLLNKFAKEGNSKEGLALLEKVNERKFTNDSTRGVYLDWTGYFYEVVDIGLAEEYYRKALEAFAKQPGKQTFRYATTLNYLGLLYSGQNQYQKALAIQLEELKVYEEIEQTNSVNYGLALSFTGMSYWRISKYPQALSFYKRSENVLSSLLGREHIEYAKLQNNLALLYEEMGDDSQAMQAYSVAKPIFKKELGEDNVAYASLLENLGFLYVKKGAYTQALEEYTQCKKIRAKVYGKYHPNYAYILNHTAFLYQELGDYKKALSLQKESRKIIGKVLGKDKVTYATILNNMGKTYKYLKEYSRALDLYEESLQIVGAKLGREHVKYIKTLSNIAKTYLVLDDYQKAEQYLLECKALQKRILGDQHPDYAICLNDLSILYLNQKKYEKALEMSIESKDLKQQVVGTNNLSYATSLRNLAVIYKERGDLEKALSLIKEVLVIRKSTLGEEHLIYLSALLDEINIQLLKGDLNGLEEQILHNLQKLSKQQLSREIGENWKEVLLERPYESRMHKQEVINHLIVLLGLVQQEKNREQEQFVLISLASELQKSLRQELLREQDKLQLLAESSILLSKGVNIYVSNQRMDKAFNFAEQNKSVLLLESLQTESAYELGDLPDSLIFESKRLLKQRDLIQAQLSEPREKSEKDKLRRALIELEVDLQRFERLLEEKYPKYYNLKHQEAYVKVKEVQALLSVDEALLEYVVTDKEVYVFYLDKEEIRCISLDISKQELFQLIRVYKQLLSNYKGLSNIPQKMYRDYTKLGHWFYANLFPKLLESKSHIQKLIVIPDAYLANIPFETFLDKQVKEQLAYVQLPYLLKRYSFSYNYSATLWRDNLKAVVGENNGQLFALAANYALRRDTSLNGAVLSSDTILRSVLNPLPAARKEVKALEQLFEGFFAFDYKATEQVVKQEAGKYAVLHFATHGVVNEGDPMLSSLVLTDNGDSLESNFLQAYEISKMQLNADLVVLSACETGIGKLEMGNGLASIARSFMYAGTPALVASLWQVNDEATTTIMKLFYQKLAEGMDKDEALRQAKLDFLEGSNGVLGHPALWSPFIQIGNTKAIPLKQKKKNLPFWIGLGSLFVGSLFLYKRKGKFFGGVN